MTLNTRSLFNTRLPRVRSHAGRSMARQRGGRGFALIEALVSLLLFSLGILGLIALQSRAVSIASDAEDRNRAALIADQCASAMQLQANAVTANNTAGLNSLQGLCQTPAWTQLVGNAANGGLPGGAITVTGPTRDFATTTSIVPVSYGITLTWSPPARTPPKGGVAPVAPSSQLVTRVTLLVKNG